MENHSRSSACTIPGAPGNVLEWHQTRTQANHTHHTNMAVFRVCKHQFTRWERRDDWVWYIYRSSQREFSTVRDTVWFVQIQVKPSPVWLWFWPCSAYEKARRLDELQNGDLVPRQNVLYELARKLQANEQSKALKLEIQSAVQDALAQKETMITRKTRMLLQSAGWLDIDKLIEHRPPIDGASFWKRPSTPQRK